MATCPTCARWRAQKAATLLRCLATRRRWRRTASPATASAPGVTASWAWAVLGDSRVCARVAGTAIRARARVRDRLNGQAAGSACDPRGCCTRRGRRGRAGACTATTWPLVPARKTRTTRGSALSRRGRAQKAPLHHRAAHAPAPSTPQHPRPMCSAWSARQKCQPCPSLPRHTPPRWRPPRSRTQLRITITAIMLLKRSAARPRVPCARRRQAR
mmetsp:Transcript_18460/g.58292  ORF Transcript_18460/g.58292 Transcript_18460/m.58292 type:complete len:215 (+) Transcript_18460:5215-5859(+)